MTDAPIATYRYTLTWQDALAYERLPREMPGLQKITLYIWLGIAGILLVALPPEVVGDVNTPRFWLSGAALVIIQYLIFWVLRGITRLNRARYRYSAPTEIVLTQWPDHLVVEQNGKVTTVPFEDISVLLPTATHLFIATGHDLIIVPALAFPQGAAGIADLSAAIDGFMREKHATADGETIEQITTSPPP